MVQEKYVVLINFIKKKERKKKLIGVWIYLQGVHI